jgi:hypothetical protein
MRRPALRIWIERKHDWNTSACGVYYDCLVSGKVLWVYKTRCCENYISRRRFWRLRLLWSLL